MARDRNDTTELNYFVRLFQYKGCDKVIPMLLEDEEVRLHAICALGDFKNPEFKPYFERFLNDKHSGWRKYAREALKK